MDVVCSVSKFLKFNYGNEIVITDETSSKRVAINQEGMNDLLENYFSNHRNTPLWVIIGKKI